MDKWQTITINGISYRIKSKDIRAFLKKKKYKVKASNGFYSGTDTPIFYMERKGKIVQQVIIKSQSCENDSKDTIKYSLCLLTDKAFICDNVLKLDVEEDFFEKQKNALKGAIEGALALYRCSFEVENVGYLCFPHVGLYFVVLVFNKKYSGYDKIINIPEQLKKDTLDERDKELLDKVKDNISKLKEGLQNHSLRIKKLKKDNVTINISNTFSLKLKEENAESFEFTESLINVLLERKYLK